MHTAEQLRTETDRSIVTLHTNGSVSIVHWSGAWTSFNPCSEALATCSVADRRRVYVHCRLNALTSRRGASDTLRYALTTVELYAKYGAYDARGAAE